MRIPLLRTLSGRIILGFTLLTLTFGTISALIVFNMELLGSEIRLIRTGYLSLALGAKDLLEKQEVLWPYVKDEVVGESHVSKARLRLRRLQDARSTSLRNIEKILGELSAVPAAHAQQIEMARGLVAEIRALTTRAAPHYAALMDMPPLEILEGSMGLSADEQARYQKSKAALEHLLPLESEIRPKISLFAGQQSNQAKETALTLERNERRLRLFSIALGITAMVIGSLITLWATMTLRPLHRLRDAARRIARGDYASRIEEQGPAEVADLAREFNVMGHAIEERERELVRHERLVAVGKMAAMITHEVRNPLSAIALNTELLEEEIGELPGAGEARSLCQAITTEVDRLTAITEEYLQFARLPRPKRQLEQVSPIARSLADFQRDQMALRGVRLETDLAESLPPVLVDDAQLRQALLNLLRNAADAVVETGGGQVTLASRLARGETGDMVELAVSDSGPGIPEEVAPKLFDPFFSTKEGGTGLGLALTHQIIREHGGNIRVESRSGRGATFVISLPAAGA